MPLQLPQGAMVQKAGVCLSQAGLGRDGGGEPKIRLTKGKKRRGAPVAYGLGISVPSSGNFLGFQQRRLRDLDSRPNAGTVPGLRAGAPLLTAQDSPSTLCKDSSLQDS